MFTTRLRFLTAGESHGPELTAILEGLPAGLRLDMEALNHELARRQQGYGAGPRMKMERDQAQILSGVMAGETDAMFFNMYATTCFGGFVFDQGLLAHATKEQPLSTLTLFVGLRGPSSKIFQPVTLHVSP